MELVLHTTYGEGGRYDRLTQRAAFQWDPTAEDNVVNLYPSMTYETLEGFGGAITEASGYVYSLMNDEQKREMLDVYFSPERMNYRKIRLHLDSCDFCLGPYEAMGDPDDRELTSFSLERMETYVLPLLRDAQAVAPVPLEIMVSPWSPPEFMKTNHRRQFGGKLLPEYRQFWADYLAHYIKVLRDRGLLIERMSVQNESAAVQTWDSCIWTPREQRDFIVENLHPALAAAGLDDIEIFIWDHNRESIFDWLDACVDEQSDPLIAGAAFHWYSGDHFEALSLCRQKFPDKKLIFSESCFELYRNDESASIANAQRLGRDLLEDLNHGMVAYYDWDILVDEKGGPNYAGNVALAPFMYDRESKELHRLLLAQYIEHFSHNLVPGSVRIATTSYARDVLVTAWKRPDESIALVALNQSEDPKPICVRLEGYSATSVLFPRSITSAVIENR